MDCHKIRLYKGFSELRCFFLIKKNTICFDLNVFNYISKYQLWYLHPINNIWQITTILISTIVDFVVITFNDISAYCDLSSCTFYLEIDWEWFLETWFSRNSKENCTTVSNQIIYGLMKMLFLEITWAVSLVIVFFYL